MELGSSHWQTFEQGTEREWLLTNGIGSFASSTVIGANTRRYHGLLVAALKAPVNRHLILSKLDESILYKNTLYNLYTNQTPGHRSNGYLYQQRFIREPVPTYVYAIEDIFIEKQICLVREQNKVVVVYNVIAGENASQLRITPLVNFRDYHFNTSSENLHFSNTVRENGVIMNTHGLEDRFFMNISDGHFIKQENVYYYNMEYEKEKERGLHGTEDHFIPGYFEVSIKPRQIKRITITAGIGEWEVLEGNEVIEEEIERKYMLFENAGYEDVFAKALVKASDDFIVERASTHSKTIIAGYPWFTDWGRDTMIALPGLTLVTKRYEDAKDILYTFSKYVKNGLIPNMFPDTGQQPIYNTVDAALWYFQAVYKYLKYTGNYTFVNQYLYHSLEQIISAYMKGTLYHIGADEDGLIYAGDEHTQLTWMDAKVGEWVVTPRHGKAVEINALWYNALNIMAVIAQKNGKDNTVYIEKAHQVKKSFDQVFWNENGSCLYDVVNDTGKDDSIRCNQIFAVSLDFAVIEGEKAKKIVNVVWQQLYATYGLRSLSPNDKQYRCIYIGDQVARDGAYHQGTVWSWPIGHFISAYRKVNGYTQESQEIANKFIEPFKDHMQDACIGSISEIFDGDAPHTPRGCFAQAWSVAEVLRAYVEEILDK